MKTDVLLLLAFELNIECKTYDVSSSEELNDALTSVDPGDTINLKSGTYKGDFVAKRSGSKNSPITLNGSRSILSGTEYGFQLKANYWHIKGFEVSGSKKGIVLEGASNNVLEDLEIQDIQEDGVHFSHNSADNTLSNSVIRSLSSGRGIYIGESVSNWIDGKPDKSDRNQFKRNTIGPNVGGECVEIKEGSCCGVFQDNVCDGTGTSAKTLVDIKGDSYLITENVFRHSAHDGVQINHAADASVGGCDNVITRNVCNEVSGECVHNAAQDCSNTIDNNVD